MSNVGSRRLRPRRNAHSLQEVQDSDDETVAQVPSPQSSVSNTQSSAGSDSDVTILFVSGAPTSSSRTSVVTLDEESSNSSLRSLFSTSSTYSSSSSVNPSGSLSTLEDSQEVSEADYSGSVISLQSSPMSTPDSLGENTNSSATVALEYSPPHSPDSSLEGEHGSIRSPPHSPFSSSEGEHGSIRSPQYSPPHSPTPPVRRESDPAPAQQANAALRDEASAQQAPAALRDEASAQQAPYALRDEASAQQAPAALRDEASAQQAPAALRDEASAQQAPAALRDEASAQQAPAALRDEALLNPGVMRLSIPSPGVIRLCIPIVQNKQPAPNLNPPALVPTPALNSSCVSESEDSSLCPICMDPLTNSGQHRVVCLRCGHIFGQSCLERWFRTGCTNGARRCPTCNKKACLKDIRILYFPKVVPLDTVERDKLIKEKEELIVQKNVLEAELSKCKYRQQLSERKLEERIEKLEQQLKDASYQLENRTSGKATCETNGVSGRQDEAELVRSIDLSKEGGCRVLAYSPILQELVVSQPSGNTLFAGFGVRILNSVDYQPVRYLFLHSKMIRDLAFHPIDKDLLLSVSLDQTAKLVDLTSSTTVHTFKGEGPLWSCCWDLTNPHLMLVGSQVGKVSQYDRRMTGRYMNAWATTNNMTPVVSLAAVPSSPHSPFPHGGFLSCRLNGIFSYARHGITYERQELPLTGPFMSMKYDQATQNLLTSARPSSTNRFVRIMLNLVDTDHKGTICLPEIHTFNCGLSARVLSRTAIVPTYDDSVVVAHHESGRTINLWSTKSGDLIQSINIREPVIDFSNMSVSNNKCLFASLSEKTVSIYKIK